MTVTEYEAMKTLIRQYEIDRDLRATYIDIRNTADTLVIRTSDGREIELIGAEPIAAIKVYVDEKIAEIDKTAITADAK